QSAPRRIPARVDELLLEILDAEIAGHLVAVDHWLAAADAAPTPASEALLRAVHTMNGAFAMAEVPAVTGVLAPAESWVRRLLVFGGNADANAVDAMGELAALVRDAISGLKSEDPGVPECDALAARWTALRDVLPEAPRAPFDLQIEPDAPDGEGVDALCLEAERVESERFEAACLESERIEAERLETERLEAERLEAERTEAERVEAERVEAARLEADRLDAECLEAERLASRR